MSQDNLLEIEELVNLNEFLQDAEFKRVLETAADIIHNPTVNTDRARSVINELSAIALVLDMKACQLMYVDGATTMKSIKGQKKSIYKTLIPRIDELVASLKKSIL